MSAKRNLRTFREEKVSLGEEYLDRLAAMYVKVLEREAAEFMRAFGAAKGELLEALKFGAEPSKLLFWLAATCFRGTYDRAPLGDRDRRTVLAGVTRLEDLGRNWLSRALVRAEDSEEERASAGDSARRLHEDLRMLRRAITERIEVNPFFMKRFVYVDEIGTRWKQEAITACMICIAKELRSHPKPYDMVGVLFQKFGLMPEKRGLTVTEFVRKRIQRGTSARASSRIRALTTDLEEGFEDLQYSDWAVEHSIRARRIAQKKTGRN